MSRILIGAMGNTIFADTEYQFESGQTVISNFFIHAIAEQHNPDKVIVLLTDSAKEANWEGKDKLKYWFEEQLPSVELIPIRIEEGKNESEAWAIFNAISLSIPDNAELIIDVTNGLRSIPILMLSALRYLQRIKNVTIREIYYCAADVVGRNVSTKPVYSVSMFNNLLDWANAVEVFLRTGNSIQLVETIRLIGKDELGEEWNRITGHLQDLSEALDLLRIEQVMRLSALLDRAIREINKEGAPDRLR
ncbi:MAG: TIGR02221 family CRISPR-associated protein, partial [Aggregatilineales bacterium]